MIGEVFCSLKHTDFQDIIHSILHFPLVWTSVYGIYKSVVEGTDQYVTHYIP